jgi:hypothetical protein
MDSIQIVYKVIFGQYTWLFTGQQKQHMDTPSVPNYLSVFIGTQMLRNLWGICENTQLGSNPSLNKLSNELFYTQNGVVNKKIWWFDCVVV